MIASQHARKFAARFLHTQERVLEFCHFQGNYCEMDSDLGGIIRYPAEEFEFFACLSEMDESVEN